MEGVQEHSGCIARQCFSYKLKSQTSRDLEKFIYLNVYIAYSHSGQMFRFSAKENEFYQRDLLNLKM